MMRFLLALATLWGASAFAQTVPTPQMDAARQLAAARQQPLLLDFHAPWCHSCFFMAKQVLTGPEWEALQQEAVVVSLDTDTPEGSHWKQRYQLLGVPTFIVTKSDGAELGRFLGDAPREQFYARLNDILSQDRDLASLLQQAANPGADGQRAALAGARAFVAQQDGVRGMAWWSALPADTQALASPALQTEVQRLRLLAAAAAEPLDTAACASAAAPLLATTPWSCEQFADYATLSACGESLAPEAKRSVLAPHRAALEALVRGPVLGRACSDNRDPVLQAVDLAKLDGDPKGATALLQAAIQSSQAVLRQNVGADPSVADNLRVFLDEAKDDVALNKLLDRLIAADPTNYHYPNRKARLLASRGKHSAALRWFERANSAAYGVNRLRNAQEWVKSLIALKQRRKAEGVSAEVLEANGPWFPEEQAKLKQVLAM